MSSALSHIRVLDLSRILAGPWATQILGDLGAEIIKIERPGTGDDTRSWGPPYMKDLSGEDTSEAAYFMTANRNKKSLGIDIASEEGQEIIKSLIKKCDVVIENFKVGGLKRYGLDYDSLKIVKPDIVYCSITGFGQTGPYAKHAGYDFLIQGMSGLMSVTGLAEEDGGCGPTKTGIPLSDLMSGLYAVIGIQAALAHRDKTGEGQHIDISLLDVQVAALANQAMNYLATGQAPGMIGNAHPNIVPYGTFETSSGHMNLTVGNDHQFRKFCTTAGRDDLSDDPRFKTNKARVKNRDILLPILEAVIKEKSLDWWMKHLTQVDVPCGPINTIDRVFADEQVIARGMKLELDHPLAGKVPLVGSPLKLSDTQVDYHHAPPLHGEHTKEVLSTLLGLTEDDIKALSDKGTIKI